MNDGVRERTFTWQAPAETSSAIFGRDPMVWLREMQTGAVVPPPAAHLMAFEIETVEPGRIVFSMRAHEWMSNPTGVVHGGLTSTLLDTVLTLAVQSTLSSERYCTTLDLHAHFVRPIQPDGEKIVGEGLPVHVGKTVATAEGRAHNASDKLVAHATATLAIVAVPGAP